MKKLILPFIILFSSCNNSQPQLSPDMEELNNRLVPIKKELSDLIDCHKGKYYKNCDDLRQTLSSDIKAADAMLEKLYVDKKITTDEMRDYDKKLEKIKDYMYDNGI